MEITKWNRLRGNTPSDCVPEFSAGEPDVAANEACADEGVRGERGGDVGAVAVAAGEDLGQVGEVGAAHAGLHRVVPDQQLQRWLFSIIHTLIFIWDIVDFSSRVLKFCLIMWQFHSTVNLLPRTSLSLIFPRNLTSLQKVSLIACPF